MAQPTDAASTRSIQNDSASSARQSGGEMSLRVFDLHCDTIDRLGMKDMEPYVSELPPDVMSDPTLVHNDAALATDRLGGMSWCQCYAIWIPDIYTHHGANDYYDRALAWFKSQLEACSSEISLVRDARDIESTLASGKVAALLTIENASLLSHGVSILDELVEDGVKMITLTWNGRNSIGSGSETSDGLTTFGREAIRAMEDRRIVIDASHLNNAGFYDLLDVARRPFVASHSNSRAVCDVPRNLTDDQFRRIRDAGGLVGLNYFRDFIVARDVTGPENEVTFDEVAAHIEHFLDLGGERVVCLGGDYDGAATPAWLDACEKIPAFHERVRERFGDEQARRLFFENARDFFVRNET